MRAAEEQRALITFEENLALNLSGEQKKAQNFFASNVGGWNTNRIAEHCLSFRLTRGRVESADISAFCQ